MPVRGASTWLPAIETEIQHVYIQLKDKFNGYTTMQITTAVAAADDSISDYEEWEDPAMDLGYDSMEEEQQNGGAYPSDTRTATVIVLKELGNFKDCCFNVLGNYLRTGGIIHTRGSDEHVICDESIMIQDMKENRILTGQEFQNHARNRVSEETGFKPKLNIKHLYSSDGYQIPEQITEKVQLKQILIREIVLQGKPIDLVDTMDVISNIVVILAVKSLGQQTESDLSHVLAEWLYWYNCATITIEEWNNNILDKVNKFDSWLLKRRNAQAESAWSELQARGKQRPLFVFKRDHIQDDPSALIDLLQNVDTQNTDIRTLVRIARILQPQQADEVFEFVKLRYRNEQSDGLFLPDNFQCTWKTPVPLAIKYDLKNVISTHIEMCINSPQFIHSSIPIIMGHPVTNYTMDNNYLEFTLDYLQPESKVQSTR